MFNVRENLAESDVTPEQAGAYFWNWIALHETLSEDDMREFADKFNWRKLSDHQKGLSESFIRENADRVHWDRICQRIQMSEEFIEEFQDKVVWDYIWSYQRHLSCDFIEKHLKGHGRVDWGRIGMYQKLDEKFIWNHIDELGIDLVIEYQKPKRELFDKLLAYGRNMYRNDEKALDNFERKTLYTKITRFKNISEDELLYYVKVKSKEGWGGAGWHTILGHQNLTEEFLEEHFQEIKKSDDLWYLCANQKLSEQFLKKHEKEFDKGEDNKFWRAIWRNTKIKNTDWIKSKLK